MIITNASLEALRVGFSVAFREGLSKAATQWDKVATLAPSTGRGNVYDWLGQFPKLREWVGDRVFKDMSEGAYTVLNRTFESTVTIPRAALEDDAIGTYSNRFKEMGYAAATHPDELVFELLKKGHVTPCFDGQPFFADAHTVAEHADGTGKKIAVSNHLVPANADNAETPWFLMDVGRPLKPLIFQERTKPELTAITTPDNDAVFTKDVFPYGIRYRCNAGFGFWQMAVRSSLALTAASFEAALNALRQMKADGGRPLGMGRGGKGSLALVVPTTLYAAAKRIVAVETLPGGGDNLWYGEASIIDCPWLDD